MKKIDFESIWNNDIKSGCFFYISKKTVKTEKTHILDGVRLFSYFVDWEGKFLAYLNQCFICKKMKDGT